MAGLLLKASTTVRGEPVATIELRFLLGEEYVASRHPHGPRPGPPLFAYAGLEVDW